MLRVNTSAEILQRTTSVSAEPNSPKKLTSEKLAQQIEEFTRRGGKIHPIPFGLPSDKNQRQKTLNGAQAANIVNNDDSIFINTRQAAELLCVSRSTASKLITNGKLKVKSRCYKTNQNLLSRADVLAYKNSQGAK